MVSMVQPGGNRVWSANSIQKTFGYPHFLAALSPEVGRSIKWGRRTRGNYERKWLKLHWAGLGWILWKMSSSKGLFSPDTAAQGSGGVPIPGDMYMWHLGTWASGGLGSAGFMVGLEDSGGLFQLKWFWDSKIPWKMHAGQKLCSVLLLKSWFLCPWEVGPDKRLKWGRTEEGKRMNLLHSLFCMQRTSKALMEKAFYIFHQSSGSDLAGWVWAGEIFMNGAAVGHCFRRAGSGSPSLLPSLFPKYIFPLFLFSPPLLWLCYSY